MSSKWITSLFKSVVLTAALASPFAASAFTEGTDYMVLEKPIPNADKTLIKVFSYACPFCYKYDKAVTGPVSDKVADVVTFTPFHLETKGEYGKQASEIFAVMIAGDMAAGISLFDAKSQFKKPSSLITQPTTIRKSAGQRVKIPPHSSKQGWMQRA